MTDWWSYDNPRVWEPSVPLQARPYQMYGIAGEGNWMGFTCPTGMYISSVDFASYGRPNGWFWIGWCHSWWTWWVVYWNCIGRTDCSIVAHNHWYGDPCWGTYKYLWVVLSCSDRFFNARPWRPAESYVARALPRPGWVANYM